jgi:hypothetical protein
MNSVWFKLYLYQLIGNGPHSLLIPRGYKLNSLPRCFRQYDKYLIMSWGHDNIISSHSNVLITINDILGHNALLVETYAESEENGAQTIHISFNDETNPFFEHPSVKMLHDKLELKYFIGYITLLNPYFSRSKAEEEVNFNQWFFLDLRYGVPLFDDKLNLKVLQLFKTNQLGSLNNLKKMLQVNRRISLELLNFIQNYQTVCITNNDSTSNTNHHLDSYLISNVSSSSLLKKDSTSSPAVVIHPTQCILFDNNKINILNDI